MAYKSPAHARLFSDTNGTSARDRSSEFHTQTIRSITTMLPAPCHGSLCCEAASGRLHFHAAAGFLFTLALTRLHFFLITGHRRFSTSLRYLSKLL